MPGMITGRLKSWAFESWWWKARPAPRSSTTHATGARGRTMDLKQAHILVTPTSFGKHDARLKAELESLAGSVTYNPTGKPLTSDAVASMLPGVDGYIAGLDVIDRSALARADDLKVISRYGVGVDNVDLDAARERDRKSAGEG